jgi:hypothetical protein
MSVVRSPPFDTSNGAATPGPFADQPTGAGVCGVWPATTESSGESRHGVCVCGGHVATIRNACSNASGNRRPRRSARVRIPAHALGLSRYRSGASACKISDNEDSTATLGHSEPACIQHSPSDVHRPDFCQRVEDRCEVVALIAAEGTDDVLPDDESGLNRSSCITHLLDDSDGLEEQV